jgi:release factor glutamine methyltransferase
VEAGARRLLGVADNPRGEARGLLAHALGLTVADLLREPSRLVETEGFEALLSRRAAHEPMAYLLGRTGFWTLDLAVSPATLIPRADSETIVRAALDLAPAPRRVLDLGAGSGCLLLAVLTERPAAWGVGVDRSEAALAVARANAITCGLGGRAVFLAADWATALEGGFDLVLANPPYIPTADIATLMPDVRDHEPRGALDGGVDGLDGYRAILGDLSRLLTPDGVAVFELGQARAGAVTALAAARGFVATTRDDLSGVARALVLRRISLSTQH